MNDIAGKQVISFIAYSEASRHTSPSSTCMFNYVGCVTTVSTATGDSFPIEDYYCDIREEFLSAGRAVGVVMEYVARVPTFNHNLFSVGAAAGQENSIIFDKDACTLQLKSGTLACFAKFGSLFSIQACPLPPPEHAIAVIAPGLMPTTSPVDINTYHCCAHGHIHEAMLRKTAEKTGVILEGTLHHCEGCSMAKGLRKPSFTVDTRPSR